MTIAIGDVNFTGPHILGSCLMPKSSGVYAIFNMTQPFEYDLLYIGESGNFEERVNDYHHKFECWKSHVTQANIYYGLYEMPNSTIEQRLIVEANLINQFQPTCND